MPVILNETARAIGTAVSSALPHEVPETIRHALENNAFVFSGFKTFHALREVGLSMLDEKGDIKPFGGFLADVKKINAQYNRNYLYAEYNHALGASQMAAKWHDFEQDGDKYDLQYRTAGDDKVREEHAILDGTTLPPSDPFWDMFLPPNGWNCRCTAVQVRKNKYPASDPELAMQRGRNCTEGAKKAIFRYNPGKSLQLFPPKHPYYKAPQEARKIVEEMAKERERREFVRYKKDRIAEAKKLRERMPNLETGVLYQTHGSFKRGISHARNIAEAEMYTDINSHLRELKFIRKSPFGEGKNLTNSKDAANLNKKRNRGITHYNIYELAIGNEVWEIKTEVYRNKAEAVYGSAENSWGLRIDA